MTTNSTNAAQAVKSKSIFSSVTLWGLVGVLLAWSADHWLGMTLPDNMVEMLQEPLQNIGFLVGIATTAYGRFRAKTALTVIAPKE